MRSSADHAGAGNYVTVSDLHIFMACSWPARRAGHAARAAAVAGAASDGAEPGPAGKFWKHSTALERQCGADHFDDTAFG